jgi:prepilin-type N-terminal cleavage/methylation domain-containing protein
MNKKTIKKGFTLIEVLVSVSIFSIVMLVASGAVFSIVKKLTA